MRRGRISREGARGRCGTCIASRQLFGADGQRERGEIGKGGRAEHLQGLPNRLLVEDGVGGVAVLDALQVLVLGPQRVAGALGRVRACGRGGDGDAR